MEPEKDINWCVSVEEMRLIKSISAWYAEIPEEAKRFLEEHLEITKVSMVPFSVASNPIFKEHVSNRTSFSGSQHDIFWMKKVPGVVFESNHETSILVVDNSFLTQEPEPQVVNGQALAGIRWSPHRHPGTQNPTNDYGDHVVRYDNIVGWCPLGWFLITWKSWKDVDGWKDSRMIDKTPWGNEVIYGGDTEEQAMQTAEAHYAKRILACFESPISTIDLSEKHGLGYSDKKADHTPPTSRPPVFVLRADKSALTSKIRIPFYTRLNLESLKGTVIEYVTFNGDKGIGEVTDIKRCFTPISGLTTVLTINNDVNDPNAEIFLELEKITGVRVDHVLLDNGVSAFNVLPAIGLYATHVSDGTQIKHKIVDIDWYEGTITVNTGQTQEPSRGDSSQKTKTLKIEGIGWLSENSIPIFKFPV